MLKLEYRDLPQIDGCGGRGQSLKLERVLLILHLDPDTLYTPAEAASFLFSKEKARGKYDRLRKALAEFARKRGLSEGDEINIRGFNAWFGSTWQGLIYEDPVLLKKASSVMLQLERKQLKSPEADFYWSEGKIITVCQPIEMDMRATSRWITIAFATAALLVLTLLISGTETHNPTPDMSRALAHQKEAKHCLNLADEMLPSWAFNTSAPYAPEKSKPMVFQAPPPRVFLQSEY